MKRVLILSSLCLVFSACSQSNHDSAKGAKGSVETDATASLQRLGDDLAKTGEQAKRDIEKSAQAAKARIEAEKTKTEAALKEEQRKVEQEAKKAREASAAQ